MSFILKYLKPHIKTIFIIIILLAIQVVTELALPHFMSNIVDVGVVNGDIPYILTIGGYMTLIALVGMIVNIGVVFISSKVSGKIAFTLREKIFKKVLDFSSTEVDNFGVSSLITRTTNDVTQVQSMLFMSLRMAIYSPLLAVGGIFFVVTTNASLTYIVAISVAVLISVVVVIALSIIPRFKIMQKYVDNLNKVSREMLSGMLVVRAFGREDDMEDRFDQVNLKLTKVALFINKINSGFMPIIMLIMNCTTIAIVWYGAQNIENGTLQIGEMMSVIQYSMMIIMSFLMLSMIIIMIPRAIVSANRIQEVLDTDFKIAESTHPVKFENQKGQVNFKNVSFKYENADDYVLRDIDLVCESGKTTAFIGSTGSGKSTLINLIPRLYDATEGEVLVDGVNIKNVEKKELSKKIGYVPQKGILFSGDIESNIKFGNNNISDEQMKKAADIAQATDFINSKDKKYKDEISQGGTNVSGGQRQRLSIARAIATDPEILIFDDSFSALDYKTDKTLRKRIKEELVGKTIIIVAQRVNTIIDADKIVVLDEGVIVGVGTHKQLLDQCSIYSEIANSQMSKEEIDNGR